jgi:uncharacterized protein YjiS (DUF1127 family)
MDLRMNSGGSAAIAGQSWTQRLPITLKRWWAAYKTTRTDRAAITQLSAMSDLQLKDFGLTRSEISSAVKGDTSRERAPNRLGAPVSRNNQRNPAEISVQQPEDSPSKFNAGHTADLQHSSQPEKKGTDARNRTVTERVLECRTRANFINRLAIKQ